MACTVRKVNDTVLKHPEIRVVRLLVRDQEGGLCPDQIGEVSVHFYRSMALNIFPVERVEQQPELLVRFCNIVPHIAVKGVD